MSDDKTLLNNILSTEERDTISEMTTVAMGAAGSTLGILLGQESTFQPSDILAYADLSEMDAPFGSEPKTLVLVQYTKGIHSNTVLVIRNADAARLAEMMMGAPGEPTADGSLDDLQTGAIGELMNQMMNSAATGLASVLHEAVEINNPEVLPYSNEALAQCLPQLLSEPLIASRLNLKIGDLPVIELLELRAVVEVKAEVDKVMNLDPAALADHSDDMTSMADLMSDITALQSGAAAAEMASPTMSGSSSYSEFAEGGGTIGGGRRPEPGVTVRPVQFSSFDHQPHVYGEENKNLELVMDVTLNLTVELGKTELSIKEVLELTRGSVIELARIAGEPVDLMANGKLIAKGEVVVIEDNFGLRITSIVSPADRLRGL